MQLQKGGGIYGPIDFFILGAIVTWLLIFLIPLIPRVHDLMSHFHMVHLIPTERHHGLYGYNEVIETLTYGLKALGHEVSYAKNTYVRDCKNIIFGHQIADQSVLTLMPEGSIVYNLEQLYRRAFDDVGKQGYQATAKHFEIWDYSTDNIIMWNKLEPSYPVSRVPIGYAPTLTRIPKAETQDIDVLIYGSPSENRIEIFRRLCGQGLRVMFLFGFYGAARDDLIARSKIVLNIGQYDKTFEIVRVSYLMANRKVVVADLYPDISIESDVSKGVVFADFNQILPRCLQLLDDDEARTEIEDRAFEIISNRNIITILQSTLNGAMVINT
jgi:hypothetical protein